jgi:ubiquinone/menaquinone biosynthesis C-methylase UbiE
MPTDSLNSTVPPDLASHRGELSDEFKRRAREQWTGDPCGADVARHLEFGTREYFDQIEDYRYKVYARWMKADLPFSDYKGKRLLEIGCGTGTDLLQFARNGADVTGVDLTPRSIEIARKRFEVYGLRGQFLLADAENLAFPDESFDAVYSFGVLHHTPDTQKAIGEVHRVLKPGCTATIMLYNKSSFLYWGPIILKRGLLQRELFKMSAEEIMSRDAEYSETGARPLVKAYTPAETRRMFSQFAKCEISVRQLNRTDMGRAGRLFSDGAIYWLERKFGWNLIITATKSAQRT